MDLRQMGIFAILAEELHFGRTAHRMHTAQPVISKAIKDMEAEVGTRLVERPSRKVELTRAGRAFLASAEAALQHADTAIRAARTSTEDGIERLTLGLTIGAAQPAAGDLVARFQAANPVAEVGVIEIDEAGLGRALAEGEIDAAIAWDRSIPAGLHSREAFEVEMKVLLPEDHPLAAQAAIRTSQLDGLPVIMPARAKQPILAETYRAYCEAEGVAPASTLEVSTTADLFAMVSGGAGVGHAPMPDGLAYPGIVIRPQSPRFTLRYNLVWARETETVLSILGVLNAMRPRRERERNGRDATGADADASAALV
ncbi:LysR substrate-binding domain-containing protein [Jannaschia aquimarina]|uniref:HcaR_1 protein n=1 Tax=Jannaschia aquimarina TaxID=935700 RepID=A0A0D1EMX9_9RHOB|nr:LysR substrate-binding domain-containing protein [Jannaschia aquimarina]KIT17060.1 Hca operon transcriptional activator [Jannaschia aquimarina]SNS82528.1 transcriptional regulator, LysR family [Jannaschia aquimarina]